MSLKTHLFSLCGRVNSYHVGESSSVWASLLVGEFTVICYGEAWRTFRKQKFGLCSTTYYLTVPIRCTQTRSHRTQSLHYDKLSKRSSLRHYRYNELRCNDISWWYIVCFARYRCNEVSLERYLREISRRLYRYLDVLTFGNPCDVSLIYRR